MQGTVNIQVRNNKSGVTYRLELTQKVTIINGDSGTGKNYLITLIDMLGRGTGGVTLDCKYRVVEGCNMASILYAAGKKDIIVIVDEDEKLIDTQEFADVVNNSEFYFIITSREPLDLLHLSANNVYRFHREDKLITLKRKEKCNLSKPVQAVVDT